MLEQMEGWVWKDGWLSGWMDEWLDGWMHGWKDRWMIVGMGGGLEGACMEGWEDRREGTD